MAFHLLCVKFDRLPCSNRNERMKELLQPQQLPLRQNYYNFLHMIINHSTRIYTHTWREGTTTKNTTRNMFRPLDVAGFCLNNVDYVKRLVKCAHIFLRFVYIYVKQNWLLLKNGTVKIFLRPVSAWNLNAYRLCYTPNTTKHKNKFATNKDPHWFKLPANE